MNKGQLTNSQQMSLEQFFELPWSDIRAIVEEKNPGLSCVCLADGYRRIVRMENGIAPDTEEFCIEYSRLFSRSLRSTLDILFKNGVKTLFFPLFGPSLLKRSQIFQSVAIPAIYEQIFVDGEFLEFFRELGIRVKQYGQLDKVDEIDFMNLNMKQGILDCLNASSRYPSPHTVYFGFMSKHCVELDFVLDANSHAKPETKSIKIEDIQQSYYGEKLKPLDLIISSTHTARPQSLPPLLDMEQASSYTFISPFQWAFNEKTFRHILFDHLFIRPRNAGDEDLLEVMAEIENLKEFYQKNRHVVLGPGRWPALPYLTNHFSEGGDG